MPPIGVYCPTFELDSHVPQRFVQVLACLLVRLLPADNSTAIKVPMIAISTSNSTSVNSLAAFGLPAASSTCQASFELPFWWLAVLLKCEFAIKFSVVTGNTVRWVSSISGHPGNTDQRNRPRDERVTFIFVLTLKIQPIVTRQHKTTNVKTSVKHLAHPI